MSQKCQSLLIDRRGRQTAQVATLAYDFAGEHTIAQHFHPEDQLIFGSRGVMTVRTKQGIWVVPPLRAVWIPAGTPHSVAILGPVSMRTLYFAPGLVTTGGAKCFVMNVSPLLRELILHACKFPKLKRQEPAHRRVIEMILDQLEAIHSIPLQLPHPSDPRAMRIVNALVAEPGTQKNAGGALRGLWGEQADDRAALHRGNENDVQPVATAIAAFARDAVAGFWRKSDGSRVGRGISQHECVYCDVPAAIGADAYALLCGVSLDCCYGD